LKELQCYKTAQTNLTPEALNIVTFYVVTF
jgi:hypothetical protein